MFRTVSSPSIRWFVQRVSEPGRSERVWKLFGVEESAGVHLLGTDQYGRDQFSRFLHGGKLSLFAGHWLAG
jgi:peptide/nickel transport system permease protein